MPQLTYLEAIRQGIWEEMERDPSCLLPGRRHRHLRRRVQSHRRLHRSLRPGARHRHSHRGIRHRRRRLRRLAHRHASGGRVSVHGFHRLRFQPDRQHGCQSALSMGRARAAGDSRSQRRQCARRPIPLAESGNVVRARARLESGLSGQRLRCQRTDQGRDPRQQSGHLFSSTNISTAASRKRFRRRTTSCRWARRASPAKAAT